MTYNPRLHSSCVYPRTHNEAVENEYVQSEPTYLATFRGTPRSSRLRRQLEKAVSGDPRIKLTIVDQKFHTHTNDQKCDYVKDILAARSVLCPRGWSPATYRMFEAMALGRCPVIISDDWIPIEGVDWDTCSIRVAEGDLSNLSKHLSERAHDLPKLSRNAYDVYWRLFASTRRFEFFLEQILDLYHRRTELDYREVWQTQTFRKANRFDFLSRLGSRLRHSFP